MTDSPVEPVRDPHPHDTNPPLSLSELIRSEGGLRAVTPRIAHYLAGPGDTGTRGALFLSQGSVVNFAGDVIVNAANTRCLGGGGVDGAISNKGGQALYNARVALPQVTPGVRCPIGDAKLTIGGDLPSRYCVHAVGPNYGAVSSFEEGDRLLCAAYTAAMQRSFEVEAKSIAFSLLSSGIFRGERDRIEVLKIGVRAIVQACKAMPDSNRQFCSIHLVAWSADEMADLEKAARAVWSE